MYKQQCNARWFASDNAMQVHNCKYTTKWFGDNDGQQDFASTTKETSSSLKIMIASSAERSSRRRRRKMGWWLMVNDRLLWMDALLMRSHEYRKKHRKITRRTFAFDEQCVWVTLNVQQQVNSGWIASNDWCVVNVCCQKKEKKKKKEISSLHGNYTVHLESKDSYFYSSILIPLFNRVQSSPALNPS